MRLPRHLLVAASLAWLSPLTALAADPPAADAPPPAANPDKSPKGAEAAGGEEEEKAKATNKIPSLDEKIRPVSGAIFSEAGRHELGLDIDFSINDPFFQKYMFGLRYAYHINNQ